MRRASAGAEVERHHQRRAAADAVALAGGERDLPHVLPGLAQARPEALAMDALADRQGIALAPFGVLEVEAGRERPRRAGEDDDRGVEVVLELARHVAQLAHRLVAHRIDAVAAVEAHDGDAPLR